MKEAPFNIGQKVVCTTDRFKEIKKESKHTVLDIFQCKKCKHWYLNVGFPEPTGHAQSECCGIIYEKVQMCDFIWFDSKGFAPIEENTYENISKELAVLPQDEVPDVKEIKELVN